MSDRFVKDIAIASRNGYIIIAINMDNPGIISKTPVCLSVRPTNLFCFASWFIVIPQKGGGKMPPRVS